MAIDGINNEFLNQPTESERKDGMRELNGYLSEMLNNLSTMSGGMFNMFGGFLSPTNTKPYSDFDDLSSEEMLARLDMDELMDMYKSVKREVERRYNKGGNDDK